MSVPADADHRSLRDALRSFLSENNYGEDGGASKRWVRVEFRPLPGALYVPNFDARRRALALHDLHHVVTGYATDLCGEAQIAAWEIGGSCGGYWAAWLLNGSALCYGCFIFPRRTFLAFRRGRHSRNLYHEGWSDALLDETVAGLRDRIGLSAEPPPLTVRDIAAYAVWFLLALLTVAGAVAILVLAVILLLRAPGL